MKSGMKSRQYFAACVAAVAFGAVAALPTANAAIIHYYADLAPEAAGATGSGEVTVDYDDVARTLLIKASWLELSGVTTVSHIHCCTASAGVGTVGVAVTPGTLPGFPAGVTSGNYTSPPIDLTDTGSFTAGFLNNFGGGTAAGAEAALIAGFNSGLAYFNIHTSTFGGGEIRGFLHQVPEPATVGLLGLGLMGLFLARRRRRA